MITLGLDTAGPAAAVALWRGGTDGGEALASVSVPMAKGHAEALMPLVASLVADALGDGTDAFSQIGRVAALSGPGSFTGVRIAVAAARGLGLAIGCPVVGVTAFEAVAWLHAEAGDGARPFAVAFDARRGQVYLQCFDGGGAPLTGPAVADLDDLPHPFPDGIGVVVGSGAALLAAALGPAGAGLDCRPAPPRDATIVARLGAGRPADAPPVPLYLRRPDAKPQGPALARAGA